MSASGKAAKAAAGAAAKSLAPLAFMALGAWLIIRMIKKGATDLVTPADKERGSDTTSDDETGTGLQKYGPPPFSLPGPMPPGISGQIVSWEANTSFWGSLMGNSYDVKVGLLNSGQEEATASVQVLMEQDTVGPFLTQTDSADWTITLKPGQWNLRTVRMSTGLDVFGGVAFILKVNGQEHARVS